MPLLRVDTEVVLDEDTFQYYKEGGRGSRLVAEVKETSGLALEWSLSFKFGRRLEVQLSQAEREESEERERRPKRSVQVKVTAMKTDEVLLSYRGLFRQQSRRWELTEASSPDTAAGEAVKTEWEPTEEGLEFLSENGVLRLRVQLAWVDREPRPANKDRPHSSQFLFIPQHSDVIVHVAGVNICAHKVFLVEADYFRGLFRSGMADAESGVVHLEETEEDARGLLTFLYRGHLSSASPWEKSDLEQRPLVYLRMADFYGLETLKVAAEEVLTDQLEVVNACEMAEVAEKWSLVGLTEAVRALLAISATPKAELVDLKNRNLPAYHNHVCSLSQPPTRHRSTQTYDE